MHSSVSHTRNIEKKVPRTNESETPNNLKKMPSQHRKFISVMIWAHIRIEKNE